MSGRPLKNYNLYKEKLLNYAKAVEIKVEFKEEVSDGVYIPSKRKIRIDDQLEESSEIATLIHELGHALDDAINEDDMNGSLGKSYYEVYKGKPTAKQLKRVIDCETKAWTFGRAIAKKLRIKLGTWYDKEEELGLADYATTETR